METYDLMAEADNADDGDVSANRNSLYPTWLHKLSEDYPTPLNEQERLTFQRLVAEQVHKYSVIHKQCNVIRKGWSSLRQVVDKLESEKAELEQSLATSESLPSHKERSLSQSTNYQNYNSNNKNNNTNKDKVTKFKEQEKKEELEEEHQRKELAVDVNWEKEENKLDEKIETNKSEVKLKNKPQRSIRRSAMFANMQNALHRATREAADTVATVTAKRERIAKETRLNLVNEDLNVQRVLIEPLQLKMEKATAVERAVEREVTELLTLLHEMTTLEVVYCSSFSLKAAGSLPVPTAHNNELLEQEIPSDHNIVHHENFMYEIHFQPAQHTLEVEDIIRSQVDEVLDSYVHYRARLDPILHARQEEEEAKRASKVRDLMQVIGLNAESNDGSNHFATPLPVMSNLQQDMDGVDVYNNISSVNNNIREFNSPFDDTVAANTAHAKNNYMFISDSDSDSVSEVQTAQMKSNVSDVHKDNDKHDRERIESALTALDDFEELY